ncbi:MAG: glutamine-hydrolyzing carbamoyl-phosphate synthase small subunit [Acidobacteria bacterium]|nr:glutamine-hydrolyzing carbamoyl-phosphate synthase small subunit [Acidobacteriota bacterium]NIM61009.1 glutamine-hydrolyzing carbamoyl-phosphate synthase small subunit [Acidobacteriota bacterium]NIO59977.1 glutamine-hydrolyzing carbamoyl-phosphate synthase small subunit [Acidobacteriota bacterium]NIQ31049.1 glutamine-hydrolyzing carbamoyl-phosphate synthase small subunit [Acidobacteriota bacterium]NIQ86177.1 glutamine-hydrolyzing carbamoyl-phosphate synthase small subunit [Acidobacteriota ba
MEAILALEDGRVFRGRSFGAAGERAGEVVFNTSMCGYQEILTDPSYRGQIVAMTCPEIGNYGTNIEDDESNEPHVAGFVVREVSVLPSNWRARQGLPQYLREHRIPGISEIDTRALTRHIRTRGAMKAIVSSVDRDVESLVRKAREAPALGTRPLVDEVTCREPYRWGRGVPRAWKADPAARAPEARVPLVAFDFGIKRNILRLLHDEGFDVTVVPAVTRASDVLARRPEAVFLSNGPGDPTEPGYAVETVRALIGEIPIFGICLGHQIAALALGAKTFKLKFGHRGANHPVMDLRDSRVAVTSQNHGYAVDPDSLPGHVEITHVNLNDQTCEGFLDREARLFAVQYHPESSPGPHDSAGLFGEFRRLLGVPRRPARRARQTRSDSPALGTSVGDAP